MGKAGAYAIQGGGEVFVSKLSGSYSGVMGLPLYETARLLLQFGIALQDRSEEHTSELQSLMRISYAVFCLKKKTITIHIIKLISIKSLTHIHKNKSN